MFGYISFGGLINLIMETLEQQKNREMAKMLMVIYILSLLRKWRVEQEKFEKLERLKKGNHCIQSKKKKEMYGMLDSLFIMLGMK